MADDRQGPTPERLARAGDDHERVVLEVEEKGEKVPVSVQRMLDGSALELLLSRGTITSDQHAAGVRLYSDWYTAKLAGSGVIDPCRVIVDGGKNEPTADHVLEAAGNFTRAITKVGKLHSNVLIDVVLLEVKLADYGRKRTGYKDEKDCRLAAIVLLKSALEELDHYYYGQRKGRMVHHGAEGYRPTELMPPNDPS